jgi:hypothetical protein
MHDRDKLLSDQERAAERNFDASELLTDTQRDRDPGWFIDGYAAALSRIRLVYGFSDDDPPNPWGPSWESRDDYTSPGERVVNGWAGTARTPEEARRRGFELLAHADIAEAQADSEGDG